MPKKKTAGIGRKHKGETKDAALLEAKRRKEAEADAAAKEEPAFVPEVEAEPEEEEPEEEPPPAKKGQQARLREPAGQVAKPSLSSWSQQFWRRACEPEVPHHQSSLAVRA